MEKTMNISYEAYRVFYYTAKTRSFTQAANALGNSQPNITRIIKIWSGSWAAHCFFGTTAMWS